MSYFSYIYLSFNANYFTIIYIYTLLLFGGLHPLCGTAVKSLIATIRNPAAASALIAPSLPFPAPLKCTSILRTPASKAILPTTSAAIPAANGVLFLDPLKPDFPGVFHTITLPFASVIFTIVLLNVALMCATPSADAFFFSFFVPLSLFMTRTSPGYNQPFVGALFLFAIVRRGPFRVRAFVLVRCPLAGNPRRCRNPR